MAINSFRLAVAIIEIEKQTSDYEKRWLILKQWLSKEEAAQQPLAPDACPECGNEYSGACGSCAVGHERG
jgi:hypothetical protein